MQTVQSPAVEYLLQNHAGYLQKMSDFYYERADFEKAKLYFEKYNERAINYKALIRQGDINSRLGHFQATVNCGLHGTYKV